MPSVIDRACRTLRDRGVVCDASEDRLVVPPGSGDGFEVTLRIVHDRQFVVTYDGWHHTFDRAEDAADCFEYGLSDSCRLKITFRGDRAVAWQVEKREYGMWSPGHHVDRRRSLAFWRPRRVVYRQNHVFTS